jgi:hypothetical protein
MRRDAEPGHQRTGARPGQPSAGSGTCPRHRQLLNRGGCPGRPGPLSPGRRPQRGGSGRTAASTGDLPADRGRRSRRHLRRSGRPSLSVPIIHPSCRLRTSWQRENSPDHVLDRSGEPGRQRGIRAGTAGRAPSADPYRPRTPAATQTWRQPPCRSPRSSLSPGTPPPWQFRGEIDICTVPDLRDSLRHAIQTASRGADVLVDLSAVTFINARGLTALVEAEAYASVEESSWCSPACPQASPGSWRSPG